MEVTVAQAGGDLLFCNSFLQHNPTPLAGHRQEKTEKMRLEQEKTDDSAEPSPKTGMIRPFDTYIHPPARQREKDVHSAACCHVQRSKNHTPSRNAKKIGLDRVEQPKILLLPLVWTTLPRPRCFASIWRCWSAWL